MSIIGNVSAVAEARMRSKAREVRARAIVGMIAALLALLAAVFGLVALTLELAERMGMIEALLLLCAVSLAGAGIMLAVLAYQGRKARELAARRAPLDRDLARAALLAAAPTGVRRVPRGIVGLGLVALGAALVLTRKAGRD